MLEKAREIISKYEEVTNQLLNPDILRNQNLFKQLSKEEWMLKDQSRIAKELLTVHDESKNIDTMLHEPISAEEKDYYNEELIMAKQKFITLQEELRIATEEIDPNDSRNIILEIRAGTGGDEAALFAGDLTRMYLKYFETESWQIEQYNISKSESGGVKEVIFGINGKDVYKAMKYEGGVHRVQRVPSTEAAGRIHTSTASVVVLPEVEDVEIELNEEDIRMDIFRSGGPGGQSVNTTDSAVRLTHIPTGIVVSCQDEKSQLKNKKRAMIVLKSRLFELERQRKMEQDSSIRKDAMKGGDRSAKIRTYNFPQNRVTDHRIKVSWHNLESILDGQIQEIIDTVKSKINNPTDSDTQEVDDDDD